MLQPLDVAIFGPLKTAFRKHLDRQGGHDSSSVVAKKRFLYYYHKARIIGCRDVITSSYYESDSDIIKLLSPYQIYLPMIPRCLR